MRTLVAAPSSMPQSRMVREMSHGTVTEIGDFHLVVTFWRYRPIPWPPGPR